MNSKKDELVSIIVPIYNVEKYVEKCILSLINQTYKNIEIILVDDGSIDSSGEICDNFGERDSRIVVIHKENGGITSARRAGIERATGRYIGFVDGDDWVELNMYKEMLDVAQAYNLDIFATAIYRDNDIETYAKWSAALIDEGLYLGEDKLKFDTKILCNGRQQINGSLNNKIFRSSIIKNNIKKISNSINGNCDDFVLLYLCLLEAKTVYISEKSYYHGYDREGSASRSKVKNWYMQVELIYDVMCKAAQEHIFSGKLNKEINMYITNNIVKGIRNLTGETLIPEYLYLQKHIDNQTKIVIYGAGEVGRNYYFQLSHMQEYKIVAWVDKQYEKYQNEGKNVISISQMLNIDYDYIIIANSKKNVIEEIKKELLMIGVQNEKIVAEEAKSIVATFNS